MQNLSQQSDVTDLLGGFKPVSPHRVCIPLYKEFYKLFTKTFSRKVFFILIDCVCYALLCPCHFLVIIQAYIFVKIFRLHCSKEGS